MPQFDIFTIPHQVFAVFFALLGMLTLLTYFYLPVILASFRLRLYFEKEMRLKEERSHTNNLVFGNDLKVFQAKLLLKSKKYKNYLIIQFKNEK